MKTATKVRPIIFNSALIHSLLNGTKTQTRRVVKPQPSADIKSAYQDGDGNWIFWSIDLGETGKPFTNQWYPTGSNKGIRCKYGQVGDRLYVKEPVTVAEIPLALEGAVQIRRGPMIQDGDNSEQLCAWADDDPSPGGWANNRKRRNAMFMPKWASRITLEVIDIRVERLQSISEADAIAEGTQEFFVGLTNLKHDRAMNVACRHAIAAGEKHVAAVQHQFAAMWDLINGKKHPWSCNPWVWVIEFTSVQP